MSTYVIRASLVAALQDLVKEHGATAVIAVLRNACDTAADESNPNRQQFCDASVYLGHAVRTLLATPDSAHAGSSIAMALEVEYSLTGAEP